MRYSDPPIWTADFIGIPFIDHGSDFAGCDCWGLVCLVYRERFGIRLPAYGGGYRDSRDGEQIETLCGIEAARAWQPTAWPAEGDVVLLRIEGRPWHVGVAVAPGLMLHTLRGAEAVLEYYEGKTWKNRIEGFYRHRGNGHATG